MTALPDSAAQYAADIAAVAHGHHRIEALLQRAFMAGALASLTSKAPREQMLAECVQFGRAIGTAAEQAQA